MISADAKGGTGRKENEREIASSELSIKLLPVFRLRFVVDEASINATSSELQGGIRSERVRKRGKEAKKRTNLVRKRHNMLDVNAEHQRRPPIRRFLHP
jgi:hypothetical protein